MDASPSPQPNPARPPRRRPGETTKQPRPGGRSARVRRAVLDATTQLLHAHGPAGVTVADVAALAGVHETSIYRRWGTRENLVTEALLEEAEQQLPVPDTGSVRADLVAYLTALAAYLGTPAGVVLDRSMAASGDDPAAAAMRERYWETRYAHSGGIVERGVARGELPAGTDPRFVVELLVAPLHFKVVLTREPLAADLPERIVDTVLRGVGALPR